MRKTANIHAKHSNVVFSVLLGLSVGDILPYKGKPAYDYVASSFSVITQQQLLLVCSNQKQIEFLARRKEKTSQTQLVVELPALQMFLGADPVREALHAVSNPSASSNHLFTGLTERRACQGGVAGREGR